jgi:hypothetical protein
VPHLFEVHLIRTLQQFPQAFLKRYQKKKQMAASVNNPVQQPKTKEEQKKPKQRDLKQRTARTPRTNLVVCVSPCSFAVICCFIPPHLARFRDFPSSGSPSSDPFPSTIPTRHAVHARRL